MGRSPKYPIKSIRREIQGRSYYSFFDANGRLFYPPSDYLMDMADFRMTANSTVEDRANTLKVFLQYLSDNNIGYLDVDDVVLEEFRDSLLKTAAPNAQRNINTRKRTINVYLRRVYDFYKWVQDQESTKRILGKKGHQIYSTLLESQNEDRNKNKYPKCYQRVGEGSKHTVNFVPSHENYTDLFDYFLQLRPDVAIRNTLMLRILRQTGLRVGSLASLTIEQFNENEIDKSTGNISVRPAVQKNGYSKEFEVPLTLAYQIVSYIDKERQEIINKCGDQSKRLFLSTTKGIPLESKRISQLFNDAARAIGWNKKGVGPHCWRRLFACETIESDIDSSIELGLDTSIEGIGLRTAEKLGHNSINSQEAYIRELKRRRKGAATSRLSAELQAERDKNDMLAIEVAKLRSMVGMR